MTVTTLDEYRNRAADADKIGSVVMISGRQTLIPLDKVRADLEAEGLGDLAPKPTAVSDLWRKATSAAARKGVEMGGKRINILIRKLKDDETEIIRSVVIETCDEAGKVLHYEESAHIIFNKETEKMRVRRLVDVGGVADDVIQELRDSFAARLVGGDVTVPDRKRTKVVPGYTKDQDDLRSLITVAVKGLSAVPLRETGGVYFVPKAHADKLAAIERVAAKWQGAQCHSLPLIEDDPENPDKQKGLVASGVTASVLVDVDALLADLRETRNKANGGKLPDRKAATFIRTAKEIRARVTEYQDLLEDGLDDALTRLQVLEAAMSAVALGAAA
jgi:hypothetical protein